MKLEEAKQNGLISVKEYHLINEYMERLESNNLPIIFNLRHLRKILKIKKSEQEKYFGKQKNELYREFVIPKKSGGYRVIQAPNDELKRRQDWIKTEIIDNIGISNCAKGFRKGSSIYHNAVEHVGKKLVIGIDLENFFSTVSYKQVYKIFAYMGYTNQVAHLLTKLCTNQNNVLPQGAPTSPGISNIVMIKLDKRMQKLAESFGADYTRYADDMTFSGEVNIKRMIPTIFEIIRDEGFIVNEKKTRLMYSNQRQEVTGLVVNQKVSLPKKTIKEIENAIYYSKKYGVISHMKRIKCTKSFYKEHLYGIAYFAKMIDKNKGEYYLRELNEIVWPY